jgi:Deoxyribonuclease NucA/NucB
MSKDKRTEGKPKSNDGSLPVMEYDYLDLPQISANIWHAQMAGWDRILTYDYVSDRESAKSGKNRKRYQNIDQSGVVRSKDSSADEYPFASTVENSGSTFIGNVPEKEQRTQGGIISSFYRRHNAIVVSQSRPFWFEVKVINYPVYKR